MKLSSLLFILSFTPTVVFSNDLFFNRLTKLYDKNPEKCLNAAKRIINYFPNECASYYYASKVYLDRSTMAKTSRSEYSLLRKAISYAAKFEISDHSDLDEKINWNNDVLTLKSHVAVLSNKLSNENQQSLCTSLVIAYSKLGKTEINLTNENQLQNSVTNEVTSINKAFMFGMPNGDENIRSSNLNEEQDLLKNINSERAKLGMMPLIWEEKLAQAARYHAYDLGTQKYFDHNTYDRVNGELVKVGGTFTRIGRFYNSSTLNSENIAAGSEHAEGTYNQWFTSRGHYENMFNNKSKKVGIGFFYDEKSPFKFYWVFCTAL